MNFKILQWSIIYRVKGPWVDSSEGSELLNSLLDEITLAC